MKETLRLTGGVVPWAEAWAMSRTRRWAFIVAAGENDGGSFDWVRLVWREREK